MRKTFYCVKLNQKAGRYLSAANIKQRPATLAQSDFDYALFFESEDLAASAVNAYLSSPNCKMLKSNAKFISVEPVEFEFETVQFPFTNKFKLINTEYLKASNNVFRSVYLKYGEFEHFVLLNADVYHALTEKEK